MPSSGWMSWFGVSKKDTRALARDAIVGLRSQLALLERKEAYVQVQILSDTQRARDHAVSNPPVALAALRQKKTHETALTRVASTRETLEIQLSALESAALNQETLRALKRGGEVLRTINGKQGPEDAEEIISAPVGPVGFDEDELLRELAALQQEKLDSQLAVSQGAEPSLPSHAMSSKDPTVDKEEAEEVRQLRTLQAEMAM